jgi:hypothetical protein
VFIQIPAYRDRELAATVDDLFGQARHPERLRVVVARRYGPDGCTSNECSAAGPTSS